MSSAIVGLSVKFRVLVIGAIVILLGLGATQLRDATVDEYPEFAPTQVEIQAEALGLSAAEVEQLITVPLEQDLLNGVPWLDQVRSESVPGLSTIDMIFTRGTDLLKARQMVQEHLTQAHALPQVGTPPVMIQPTASAGRILMASLGAKDLSLIDLSILARWKIKPRLEGIPGVANVAIWGQRDRQLQVQVDPQKLRQYGVTLNQVVSSTGNALWVSPLTFVEASTPGTGGFVDTAAQRLGIQHITPITTAKGLSAVTIEDTGGRTLRLGQVANVVEDHQPLIGDAVLDNSPGLMLVIQKFPGANTREVNRAVEEALDEMKPGLAGVTIDTSVYRPASFLSTALHNLAVRAVLGFVLICALLGAYLLSWRLALISVVTMLLSLVCSAYVLYLRGVSFDVMVLAGLVAAIGVVLAEAVTNAAVTRAGRTRPPDGAQAAPGARASTGGAVALAETSDADEEFGARIRRLRAPLVYASLILLLVPLPSLFVGGIAGSFARSLVLSYVLAVAVAMLVAHLAAPALGSLLGRDGVGDAAGHGARDGAAPRRSSPLARLVERGYDRAGRFSLRQRGPLYACLALLLVAGIAVIPQLDTSRSTLPKLQDRDLTISWRAAAGTSLPEMVRVTALASRDLRAVSGVRAVSSHVGRALMADQSVNVNSAELWVSLKESAKYNRTVAAVQAVMNSYPGMRGEVSTYPADRVAAADEALKDPVVVRVFGHDLTQLAAKAGEIQTMLATVAGIRRPAVQAQNVEPSVQVQVDLAKAERYGITPGDVRRASATFFAGLPVGSLYEDQKIFDVVVWGVASARQTPADLANLVIDTPAGGRVRLGDVADVRIQAQPTVIRHNNISRSIDVTAGVSGRSVDAVVKDVRSRLASVSMPLEFHAEVLSASLPYQAEHRRVAAAVVAALIAILLLLQLALGSWRLAVLSLLVTPIAVSGGLVATAFVGGVRSLPSMLGLLAVLGLAIRSNLLLIRDYQDVPRANRAQVGAGVLAATRQQLTAIVLPALLTAAAMLPLALGGVHAGTELLQPMAVVCLAGLITSTLVSLLLLPALYLRLGPRSGSGAAAGAGPGAGRRGDDGFEGDGGSAPAGHRSGTPAPADPSVPVAGHVPAGVAPIMASAPNPQTS